MGKITSVPVKPVQDPRGPGRWGTGPRCWGETRCRGLGGGPGQLRSLRVHGDGDREGTAIVLCLICRHKEAAQPAVRPFLGANGYGAEAVRGGAECETPVLPLHATHPNPPDACCLPCLCLLRPLPAPQLSSRPPGPSPLRTPGRCERRPRRQMATFGSRVVPACGTLLGCDDHPSRKPPPHPARAGEPVPTTASTGQAVQWGSPGWAHCPCHGGDRVAGGHGRIGSPEEQGSVPELSPGETHPLISSSMCEQWGWSAWAEGGCCSIAGRQGDPLTPGTTGHLI